MAPRFLEDRQDSIGLVRLRTRPEGKLYTELRLKSIGPVTDQGVHPMQQVCQVLEERYCVASWLCTRTSTGKDGSQAAETGMRADSSVAAPIFSPW